MTDQQRIVMNFTVPPLAEDIEGIAGTVFESLPEEILEFCDNLVLKVEEVPGEDLEVELELEDPYDLCVLYSSGKQLAPGVEKKDSTDNDTLTLFRRSILDLWCEVGEDISLLIRELMIEELGSCFDFSDEEIEEMISRHHQWML